MQELPEKVGDHVAKLVNNPLAPISSVQMQEVLNNFQNNILQSFSDQISALITQPSTQLVAIDPNVQQVIPVGRIEWKSFVHSSGLKYGVPEGFKFRALFYILFYSYPIF